jgi:threonine dehydratase
VVSLPLDEIDQPVAFKCEHMQKAGSFKTRGAFNTLLSEPVPPAGLVAASGGNHGAAVAHAALELGHKARIFVPELSSRAKIEVIRETGTDLTVVPGTYAEAFQEAQEWERASGAMQIHAYDAPATVNGQGTVMREWEEQGLDADTVLIAVGGGGLISGALAWLEGSRRVIAVESETTPTLHHALAAGTPVDVEISGIAADALGAKRIGSICFDLAKQYLTDSILVSDEAIQAAQQKLWRDLRVHVEPAGAAGLAALLSGTYRPEPGEKVAVLLCGANPPKPPFASWG